MNGLAPLESIPIAQVAVFFGRSPEGGDSETWRATLVGSSRPAWVKFDADPRKTIADLVAAQVGRAMRLPIPKPYIAEVDLKRVPKDSRWHGQTGTGKFFASQHAGKHPRSFARAFKEGDAAMLRAISAWSGLTATMVFDEWIANDDRHNGNLLYDPASDGFWLIDHGRALTGEYWPVWGLDDAAAVVSNELAKQLVNGGKVSAAKAADVEREANRQMCSALELDWAMLDKDGHIRALDPNVEPEAIRDFLMQRIEYTTRLLMEKLGHPQLDLAHEHVTRPMDAGLH